MITFCSVCGHPKHVHKYDPYYGKPYCGLCPKKLDEHMHSFKAKS